MSDPIDRQAALDIIKNCYDGVADPFVAGSICYDRIKQLPSVQQEIIRCKDCKHLFEDNKCPLRTWWTHTEDDFCSYAERREDG